MRRLELTVPLALLEDVGGVSERFFRHNEAVDVLQSFPVRPGVAALIVRVRRRGPFKEPAAIRREARAIVRRYRLERFEVLASDPARGEYLAWIEWTLPALLRGGRAGDWAGVVPLGIALASPTEARVDLLATEAALPKLRAVLDALGAPVRVRSVRAAPPAAWGPLGGLTRRQRDLLELAYRLGYYESPARTDLGRLAGLLGISKAAVSKHLRAAERKVLGAAIGTGP